jgi:diguanylate cyclase (GGDEF)-like protein
VLNRRAFTDAVGIAMRAAARSGEPLTIALIDLDDFKLVNDTLGHAAGDELLVEVADRLRHALRTADTVARLGGDEFAVLLDPADDVQSAVVRALEALRPPVDLAGRPVSVRASAGVCVLGPEDPPARADTLLVRSDAALYAAKRGGKDRVVRFTPGLPLQPGPRLGPVLDRAGGVLTP